MIYFLILQLGREFNRIMGSDVVSHIRDVWTTMHPKIVAVGKEERKNNHYINKLMIGLPTNIPNGQNYIIIIHVSCSHNIVVTTDDLQVFVAYLLYYLAPDVNTKMDVSKIVTLMKVCS